MYMVYVCLLLGGWGAVGGEEVPRQPKVRYQRHYEKEDILIPSASGYFPQSFGTGLRSGGFGFGGGSVGNFGAFGGGFGGGAFGKEGGYFNKDEYDKENKNVNEQGYHKAQGNKGSAFKQGAEGFQQDAAAVKNKKGDAGYYNDESGAEKSRDDGRVYQGEKHFDESGKKGEQNNEKKGYKKGYSTKGFKTASHKNEEEKSETFYDEAHDEAEDAHFKGQKGAYGQNEGSKFKGGHENESYNKVDKGEKGQFQKANVLDTNKGEKGQYGQQTYADNGAMYGVNNGQGVQSVLGHQEVAGAEKQYGHKTIPFYGGY